MVMRTLENVGTMFLDMNGTFMFGHDHLGHDVDFFPAYARFGGLNLARAELNHSVRRAISRLDELYQDESYQTRFPHVADVVRSVLKSDVGEEDQRLVERVIAAHEMGVVSAEDTSALRKLSERFRLVVVSNLWSRSEPWRDYLARIVGESIFFGFVFSSDIGVIKPAAEIFQHAFQLTQTLPGEVVMVGDDIERDIQPAR